MGLVEFGMGVIGIGTCGFGTGQFIGYVCFVSRKEIRFVVGSVGSRRLGLPEYAGEALRSSFVVVGVGLGTVRDQYVRY